MPAVPHIRDLPKLARAVASTSLRPVRARTVVGYGGLDIVADLEGFAPGWWAGALFRRELWEGGRPCPSLWVVVATAPVQGKAEWLWGRVDEGVV